MYSMCSENVTIFSGSSVSRGIRVIDDSVQVAWKRTFASNVLNVCFNLSSLLLPISIKIEYK